MKRKDPLDGESLPFSGDGRHASGIIRPLAINRLGKMFILQNGAKKFCCLLLSICLQVGLVLPCIAKDHAELQAEARFSVERIRFGNTILLVEVASTHIQREQGLMFRTELDQNRGMIFLMPRIDRASFWMKNTLIPLSIAYLDKDGRILEIEDKQALDTTITHTRSDKVAYVLEANLHWFVKNRIGPGATISPVPSTWNVLVTP